MPVKVLDIDLYRASGDIMVQGPYHSAAALIRWRGVPIGQLKLTVSNQRVSLTSIQEGARKAFGRLLASRVVEAIPVWRGGWSCKRKGPQLCMLGNCLYSRSA
jgi:hypothetical protein